MSLCGVLPGSPACFTGYTDLKSNDSRLTFTSRASREEVLVQDSRLAFTSRATEGGGVAQDQPVAERQAIRSGESWWPKRLVGNLKLKLPLAKNGLAKVKKVAATKQAWS
eukprot:TRINITY_DN70779_c0_g1_i1.p1 TRINITY_DN70779_c0_g1~~TRINITY_DN70779_c0_g1_i1.p1  ORF type:complete len:110 (+),score=17.03 TRINITY_DN70779_c0_g1_i1:83-412(+)